MITIATMGKFSGVPTLRSSAKYGGGTSAAVQYKEHKFPIIRITHFKDRKEDINIYIKEIEEI